ncbi:MAG: HAMP domain-containing histidine kinase [Acidobacteria bacterium]|nr:HAMP domain-containing histidine kinase [Acidobacteriota bacterium]MBI3423931.1 HAMP domain-containing histidine kinase [Acidobacteriota bacterium]
MKHWKRQPPLILWLSVGLLLLLPMLAYLQYRWLGEVSQAEQERRLRNLKASALQFGQDFDQEVTFAYESLQDAALLPPDPAALTSLLSAPNARLAAQYQRWLSAAPHPHLVQAIYQVAVTNAADMALTRFNTSTEQFEPCDWPAELAALRKRLLEQGAAEEQMQQFLRQFADPQSAGSLLREHLTGNPHAQVLNQEINQASGSHREMIIRSTKSQTTVVQLRAFGPVDESLPGLVIPLERTTQVLPLPRKYRLVQFDLACIKNEIFPALAAKHLASNGVHDYLYQIRTVDNAAAKLVYASEGAAPESLANGGDVAENFFKVRFSPRDQLFFKSAASAASGNQAPDKAVKVITSEVNLAHTPPSAELGDRLSSALKRNADGPWQLVIRHRAGSLEAAVATVRRRNLAISFGVLLLLGVSVGLIVLSSRRAQHLAEKQIEFVAGVSHELRTPLTVICAAAENLADGVPGLVDNRDQVKRYGTLIRDEGRRLTSMVEQVLEFAGAQAGKQSYDLRPVAPERVIEDALAALHLSLQESDFVIEEQLPAELPLISADSAALSRALQNLISNALKYGGEQRWLGLSARVIRHLTSEELQLAVADRGRGIPAEELPHIFDPFYRGKEVTAAQIHGNGLGLSLVKHIVEAHGGRITVESKVGVGSTFTLHLPVLREATSSTPIRANEYEQAPSTH